MTELFLKIVNMSISATYLALAVILLRFALKKAPKWVNVLLWGLVAIRLACPFTLESTLSLIPSAETVSPEIMLDPSPTIHTGIEAVNSTVNPVISETFSPAPGASANPLQIWIPVLSAVWVVGMALMWLYTLVSYQHLHRQVKMAIRVKGNVYLSEFVSSPFVLGVFRPKIYLPYHMNEQDRTHVLAHERTHIRRRDHWWKPLGFLLLTIHWFNPVMWAAYILLCRDIELACDEKVIQELGTQQRADYSQALLNCSIDRKTIAACPVAFGEVGVKERVKNVLNYKKPGFWLVLVSVFLCAVVAVCFLTNPETTLPFIGEYTPVLQAETVDQRGEDTLRRSLNADEREELAYRLRDIAKIKEYETDIGNTIVPLYCLTAEFEKLGSISVEGISWDGSEVLLRFQDKLYQINDPDFAEYLSTACSGGHIAAAENRPWGQIYHVSSVSYEASIYDLQIAPETAPLYALTEDMTLQIQSDTDPSELVTMGTFTEISLSEENFDRLFRYDDLWQDRLSSESLRRENQTAWSALVSPDMPNTAFFYLLLQENGEVYLVWGYNQPDSEDAVIRNVFLLEAVSSNDPEATPYIITSTLTADNLRGSADYLPAGGGYNFFDYMDEEIVEILNSLTEADFLPTPGIIPDTTITLSKGALDIILNSDGEYVEFSFDAKTAETLGDTVWAVKNEALNGFFTMMNSYSPENSTYEIYNVAPLEELPRSYNLEEATIDKCVIMVDGDVRDNQDVWEEFIASVSSGAEDTVRYVTYYSGSENEASQMFIHDLTYDGSSYTLRWFEDGTEYVRNYRYLRHFTGEAETPAASYDAYEHYVLTDNTTATYEELWRSLASSRSGDAIDHHTVYSDLIYYVRHPEMPGTLTSAALEQDGETIITITDTNSLEKLCSMFTNAEALGYEPGTYGLGLDLIFTGADGKTVTAQLDWYNDLCCIDGVFYDYGPGYTDDGTYDGRPDLFRLLGVTYNDPAELDRILYSISEKSGAERLDALLELYKFLLK